MKEEPKKLNKYYILVLVLILIIGIISATYAFFQIDTDNSTASTTITANADCFNITFEDISEDVLIKLNVNYPITDEYALGQTNNQDNLKPVVVRVSNKCTQIQDNLNYKLAITTLAKHPIDEQDKGYIPDNKVRYNVKKSLNTNKESDLRETAYLNSLTLVEDDNIISLLEEEITKKEINIKEYNTVNTYIIDSDSLASNTYSTYYIKLWIDYYEGDSEAYTNPEDHEDRTYPCDSVDGQCKYDNSTEGQKFESVISLIADGTTSERTEPPKSTIDTLREKEAEVSGGVNYLSTDLQGGMYRYQGTDDVPNWILFGTREKCEKDEAEKCTNSKLNNMTYDEYVDKYMYRIIGITEEGQLYLLKETFIKEGTGTLFTWNDKYYTSGEDEYTCDDKVCPEWNTSLLFKRINGTSNGETQGKGSCYPSCDGANSDIFVDSSEYEYLKSGDGGNGASAASEWYNLIADHEWMYGDTTNTTSSVIYNGKNMYDIETGQTETTHYVGTDGSNTQETYRWTEKTAGKISLMYIHDVAYAYYDGSQDSTRGNPGSYTNVANSWINFRKDGYNTSSNYELLSTRWGVDSTGSPFVGGWFVGISGDLKFIRKNLYAAYGVRPVFYLESSAKIVSGDGTKSNPYILA